MSAVNVDVKPAPTAQTDRPVVKIDDPVTGPITHIAGSCLDVARDRPTAHGSPRLTIRETPVPGKMVLRRGSDRSSQYS
jgi:hypothetical protein